MTRPRAIGREIARGEDERRRADETEHEEEVAAQGIDAEARLELARERGAELVSGREHREAGQPDQRDAERLCAEARQERPGREGKRAPDSHHDEPRGEKRPDHEAPTLPLRSGAPISEPSRRDPGLHRP